MTKVDDYLSQEQKALPSFDHVLIHYSEIALKGNNRPYFERRLLRNVKDAAPAGSVEKIERLTGRLVATVDPQRWEAVAESLRRVPGVSWFARTTTGGKELEEVEAKVVALASLNLDSLLTFKVVANRADKSFPMSSPELASYLGDSIRRQVPAKVSLDKADVTFYVDIVEGMSFVYLAKQKGIGGLPVGVSGKVLALVSGGIDSPVATWLMMRRGCETDIVHFYSSRDLMDKDNEKILAVAKLLSSYCSRINLHMTPFHHFQLSTLDVPENYELPLFRRFMFRLAEKIAEEVGIKGLVAGDNIGQVASQTLDNLYAVDTCVRIPIYRPLLTFTKEEIVDLAKKVGSYSISIMKQRDCCSLLARHPVTNPKLDLLDRLEADVNMDKIVEESRAQTKEIIVEPK